MLFCCECVGLQELSDGSLQQLLHSLPFVGKQQCADSGNMVAVHLAVVIDLLFCLLFLLWAVSMPSSPTSLPSWLLFVVLIVDFIAKVDCFGWGLI